MVDPSDLPKLCQRADKGELSREDPRSSMEAQFEHLANNPDMVIATPGRLMHHILEAELSLSRVEILVFDEADRLFELGFAEQLQKILDATPSSRQCLLFSATLPAQLVSFSRAGIKDPAFIRLDVETSLSESLDLFVATKHHVEFFGELLQQQGLPAATVYGTMDQTARQEQVARFRKKQARILVTTDVAARGVDIPALDHALSGMITDEAEGTMLRSLFKSMQASYNLYNKTRPSASKSSVARAKKLMEECGGAAQLQSMLHPAFSSEESTKQHGHQPGSAITSSSDMSYIRTLRGFRPKIEKLGNVLSVGAMRTMEQAKLDAAAVAATVSTEETQAIFSKGHQAAEVEEEPEQEEAEVQTVAKKTRDKPRMSKKARKQSKGGPPGVTSADADFDIKVSGDGFGESKASSKRETGEQFYLSTAVDLTDEARERGFDMEQYQMDLLPDDSSDIKKAKSVMRWDAKRKKYLPTMVTADGRALKGQRRNESGKKVKGEAQKSNIYEKWSKATKKRIQKELDRRMELDPTLVGCVSLKDCHKLHLSIATAEHMVRRRDGLPFDKNSYYSQPDDYEPTFQDSILPYATVVLNGMYWDDLHRHVVNGRDKLLGVCDITCDADGSVPTRQFASIEQPFHILNALTERISPCLDDPGILFHAVDHLPSELPRESSEHFGDCLVPFLPSLASQLAPMAPLAGDEMAGSANLPMPIRGAIITEGGQLARDYRYIQQLRDVREGKVVDVEENISPTLMPPACYGLTGSAWGDWANYADSPLRAFEEELGIQAPVGFWDPVGYTRDGNMETFKRRRETEIKHGRVAMYATMGYIVPEYFKWPGYLSPSLGLKFDDVPNGLAAIAKVPGNGWAQIVAFAGYYELFVYKYNGTPGDYGWKAISSADAETKKRKLSAELANGRLAMMAIIGMFFQDGLTGSAWGDWANYTDSPLRAFENETGVQPPVGFWDPLGLSTSGNQSDYKRRREVELKHGRVAMFATIGYILPEYWRFPGYLSKFLDIKFADVPNGLSAFSKVPALGWLQIVGFAGIVELNVYNEEVNGEPGNYGSGFLGLRSVGVMNSGIADPEVRKKKLNAELANGTLEFTGHLFDSRLINRVADMCEESVARMQILVLDLGRTVNDESFCSMMVMASSEKSLETLVVKLETAAAESHVTYRRATQGALRVQDAADPAVSADLTKKVLVLGSGHVASPLIAYLARKPTELVVASVEQKELNALRRLPGLGRVLDIAAADHDSAIAEKLETFVKESDLVISLLPAHMHVGVAKMAIQHGVSMVTASYVSPEMAALHEAAEKAGVLILNEVGLDPGIDHLSAMSMIDTARTRALAVKSSASPLFVVVCLRPKRLDPIPSATNSAGARGEDGLLREIAGEDLLAQGKPITINNAFALDVLPNRDSTMFAELYGLADIPTFIRGTLRFRGFCERMLTLSRLGLLQVGPIPGLADPGSQRVWLEQVMFGGNEVGMPLEDVRSRSSVRSSGKLIV
eukprot:g15472.t1